MGKVKVVTDSTCDLSPELLKAHNIDVVPLYVVFGEDSLKDGKEICTEELYEKVEEIGQLPKTSAASPGDFVTCFEPLIEEGYDIIYIGISSKLSSTLQNAAIAAQNYPEGRIEIVDSYNLSTGIGLLVMKAVDYAQQGLDVHQIAEKVKGHVKQVETEFIIDTLEYLYKGGRCSALQNFIGTMLKIRPVVKVVDGKMILADKIRGRRERALKALLDHAYNNREIMDNSRIFITHSLSDADSNYLKEELAKNIDIAPENILITNAGCVISSHCGKNTVGILYITQ